MKLGTDVNQIVGFVLASGQQPKPFVGMACTNVLWTDRAAYTIVRVSKSGKRFWAVRDAVTRTDKNGTSECQTYAYAPGNGPEVEVRVRKSGDWKSKTHGFFVLGVKSEYRDFSF